MSLALYRGGFTDVNQILKSDNSIFTYKIYANFITICNVKSD